MAVTGHFSVRNLLDGTVNCVEEGFCFVSSWRHLRRLPEEGWIVLCFLMGKYGGEKKLSTVGREGFEDR